MLVVVQRSGRGEMIVPALWELAARECADVDTIRTVAFAHEPLHETAAALIASLPEAGKIGMDGDAMTVALATVLSEALKSAGHAVVECGDALKASRMIKTPAERERLEELALKTDHAINGYFHHLIANRASSALVISEQLRIHSLERDIELSGYNACARAKVGEGTKKFGRMRPITISPAWRFGSIQTTRSSPR